jgi:hypothetical protein
MHSPDGTDEVTQDHHCPYTNSCVGGRNLKAFVLFCCYGALFAVQFFVLSIVYYFKMSAGKTQQISELSIVLWMVLTFISFLLSISLTGLTLSSIVLASKNMTQIEIIKGLFVFRDPTNTRPNPFDLGLLSNLNSVFNGDYWLFWWPTPITSDNDFTEFPMRPPVIHPEIKALHPDIQNKLEDPNVRAIPHSIEELRRKEENKYERVIFYYLNKPYQLAKVELKETLAEINNVNPDKLEEDHAKEKGEQTEEDKQILAGLYD